MKRLRTTLIVLSNQSRYLLVLLLGSLLLTACPPENGNIPDEEDERYTGSAIARGLVFEIQKVTIPADNRPEISFTLKDIAGNHVPLNELTDLRFALAYLDNAPGMGDATRFVNYTPRVRAGMTQATSDSARLSGTTQNSNGSMVYKFNTALPGDYSRVLTHQVGAQARRLYPVDNTIYPAEVVFQFRPDGNAVQATREVVATETCNKCHTRLEAHGGVRREVQHCIVCHTPQTFDDITGRSLDFAEMIHKIHRGHDLPSVQDGESYILANLDFSPVAFPQDIRNCTVCHTDAPHAAVYLEQPTRSACVACHDRTWFGNRDEIPNGYTMHVGGQQINDNLCQQCHTPTAPGPSPIFEAHMRPHASPAAPGLRLEITNIEVLPAEGSGGRLRITFDAIDKNGLLYSNASELNALGATIAYPAPEYEIAMREPIVGGGGPRGTLVANMDGSFSYTFSLLLPDLPDETFAVAMDGRVSFSFRGQNYNQGTSSNAYSLFTLDGSAPTARRAIVNEENCNQCHDEIRFHGESRVGVNLCVMCHNVNATDVARRPADALPPESINFKDLIHSIHRGVDLANDFTVYGFGNVPHHFSDVRFPGRLESCNICHLPGTEQVPVAQEALSTMVTHNGELIREVLPERAACTSCHDHLVTNVHAILATSNGVESCATCHGSGSSFSVDWVHQLRP